MSGRRWTPPRWRGLEIVGRGQARISNVSEEARGLVYWQVADWLIAEGLADCFDGPYLEITPAGKAELEVAS